MCRIFRQLFLLVVGTFLCGNSYAIKPSKTYEAIPDTLKLPYEKNIITTSDNVKLQSWTFLPDKSVDNKITLVLAYADAGNMSWWLMQATILSQVGFTVVMFDYRGFGSSDPFTIDPKMLYYNEFANDLSAVVLFAKGKYPKHKTGIWAFSMGTIIATLATPAAHPDFIVGDGYITDPIKVQAYYAEKKDEILLPANAGEYGKILNSIKVPMLVFSGKKDEVATNAALVQWKKTHPATTIVSFNGGHMEGFSVLSKEFPGSEYIKAVKHFLKLK